ncbi:MAG: signal peptide peptidase SppA [Nitrospirota bacterium]|nr:signal peptide peptidase SppA [Nitrospirota bacterium]
MAHRKSLLVGGFYFLIFSGLFFIFAYWLTAKDGGDGWGSGNKIALIRVEGVILDSRKIVKTLRRYGKNPDIKGILIRIDSPGGGVAASQEIYDELIEIQREGLKKVVSSMGTVAASGGYYIASATDLIVANPGTLTGSIGVIMELTNIEGLLNKIGVEGITIKSGKNKDVGSPFRKMKKEERALLQNVLDDVHSQFIEAVAEGRSLHIDEVRRLADGRIFTGRQAQEVGLVDELGSLQWAIQRSAELAGIEGKPQIIEANEKTVLSELLENRFFGTLKNMQFPVSSVGLHYLFSM